MNSCYYLTKCFYGSFHFSSLLKYLVCLNSYKLVVFIYDTCRFSCVGCKITYFLRNKSCIQNVK